MCALVSFITVLGSATKCQEVTCPHSSSSAALLRQQSNRPQNLSEESAALLQHSSRQNLREASSDGCPCLRGACFDKAPWIQLEQSGVSVRPLYQVTAGTLKWISAQYDALWVTSQPYIAFHSGMMGSPNVTGWTELNSTPSAYVDVRSNTEASQTINFARAHNLKLVIMSTGHDWFGRSFSPGLLMWTHNQQDTEWHESFQAAQCSERVPAVTLGAGVQIWQVVKEMQEQKRLVVTGTCATVGHVGCTLGGCYGDYSRYFGSGATNLLEAEVVLATGETVTASECNQYSDLFKALRGGGPGYGLVTKLTYRSFDQPWVSGSIAGPRYGDLAANLNDFFSWYKGIVDQGLAKHFGGIIMFPKKDYIHVELKFVNLSPEDCEGHIQNPFFKNGYSRLTCKPDAHFLADLQDFKTSPYAPGLQQDWLKDMSSSYHVGTLTRYVEPYHLEGGHKQRLARALKTAVDSMLDLPASLGMHTSGTLVSLNYALGGSPAAVAHFDQTSANPQVKLAVLTVKFDWRLGGHIVGAGEPVNQAIWDAFAKAKGAVDDALPTSGGYVNEGDISEVNWPGHYWGSNYDFLLGVKRKYDPLNLFTCFQCVGADQSGCARR